MEEILAGPAQTSAFALVADLGGTLVEDEKGDRAGFGVVRGEEKGGDRSWIFVPHSADGPALARKEGVGEYEATILRVGTAPSR